MNKVEETYFESNIKEVVGKRKRGVVYLALFIALFMIVLIIVSTSRFDYMKSVIVVVIMLFPIFIPLFFFFPLNPFIITNNGVSPPRRGWWMMFARKKFIYYNEIKAIRKENIRYSAMQPKEGLWVFYLTLKNDKEVYISIRDVGQQLDSEKQLNKAYGMLNVIMDELQKPENIEKYRKGEEIILPREIFNHHPHHS